MNDPFRHSMPPDPFAGDPNDPASELAGLDPSDAADAMEPLSEQERVAVEEDLADLKEFRRILAPIGIKGIVVQCEDCAEDHFHEWDMLRANLMQLLADGAFLPHEPAFNPSPEQYVTWDYCLGYVDAVRAMQPRRAPWRRGN